MEMSGVHPAFFVLVCGVVLYLVRRLNKFEEARQKEVDKLTKEISDMFEKRIDEQRSTLQTLDRNAVNMAARTAAIDSTVAAMAELTQGFARVVYSFESHREQTREQAARIERQLEDTTRMMRELR